MCLNFDYNNGTMELFLNGNRASQTVRKPLSLPDDYENLPLIVRMGHYYYDATPLIGKIVNINLWDR